MKRNTRHIAAGAGGAHRAAGRQGYHPISVDDDDDFDAEAAMAAGIRGSNSSSSRHSKFQQHQQQPARESRKPLWARRKSSFDSLGEADAEHVVDSVAQSTRKPSLRVHIPEAENNKHQQAAQASPVSPIAAAASATSPPAAAAAASPQPPTSPITTPSSDKGGSSRLPPKRQRRRVGRGQRSVVGTVSAAQYAHRLATYQAGVKAAAAPSSPESETEAGNLTPPPRLLLAHSRSHRSLGSASSASSHGSGSRAATLSMDDVAAPVATSPSRSSPKQRTPKRTALSQRGWQAPAVSPASPSAASVASSVLSTTSNQAGGDTSSDSIYGDWVTLSASAL